MSFENLRNLCCWACAPRCCWPPSSASPGHCSPRAATARCSFAHLSAQHDRALHEIQQLAEKLTELAAAGARALTAVAHGRADRRPPHRRRPRRSPASPRAAPAATRWRSAWRVAAPASTRSSRAAAPRGPKPACCAACTAPPVPTPLDISPGGKAGPRLAGPVHIKRLNVKYPARRTDNHCMSLDQESVFAVTRGMSPAAGRGSDAARLVEALDNRACGREDRPAELSRHRRARAQGARQRRRRNRARRARHQRRARARRAPAATREFRGAQFQRQTPHRPAHRDLAHRLQHGAQRDDRVCDVPVAPRRSLQGPRRAADRTVATQRARRAR